MPESLDKHKYNIYLAAPNVTTFRSFLTEKARENSIEIKPRLKLPYESLFLIKATHPNKPEWATRLNQFFEINERLKSSSASAVLLFKCQKRILACTFGHGYSLLDTEKKVSDFGLKVAVNSLSPDSVKHVEKADLGTTLRDLTQASSDTKLQEFDVHGALNLIRRITGKEKNKSSLNGAQSISLFSEIDIDDVVTLGEQLLKLYLSKAYRETAFAVLDKITPISDKTKVSELNDILIEKLNSSAAEPKEFELGIPEIVTEPTSSIKITGVRKRQRFHDVNLTQYLELVNEPVTIDLLHQHKLECIDVDGKRAIGRWSIYKGLIGSLDQNKTRYAINEGEWYRIDSALRESANASFEESSMGLDESFPIWKIQAGKNNNDIFLQRESEYNRNVVDREPNKFKLLDTVPFHIPNEGRNSIEICDIFDFGNKKLIHVKRSGRRSSIISHFLNQGLISAKNLAMYPDMLDEFLEKLVTLGFPNTDIPMLKSGFPHDWTIEYKFADIPNDKQEYVIPFFSRIAFESIKREILALKYKAVEISFIQLSSHSYTK